MHEVIQNILKSEEDAKRLVHAAEVQADSILSSAQKKAQEIKSRTENEAQAEAQTILQDAIKAAEQEKNDLLRRIVTEIESSIRLDESTKERAVEAVLRCVRGSR